MAESTSALSLHGRRRPSGSRLAPTAAAVADRDWETCYVAAVDPLGTHFPSIVDRIDYQGAPVRTVSTRSRLVGVEVEKGRMGHDQHCNIAEQCW